MKRILILGRGGAGKSTLARKLGHNLQIPVIELDKEFWSASLDPLAPQVWAEKQQTLCQPERWIMDGDLGPYDVLETRLSHCDTVILLDFSLPVCLWRAFWRARERLDFWLWVTTWRRKERPKILAMIARRAPAATLITLRNQRQVDLFLNTGAPPQGG